MSGDLKVDKISPSTNDGFLEIESDCIVAGSLTVNGSMNLNADTVDTLHATANAIDTAGEEDTLATKGQVKDFVEQLISSHDDEHNDSFFPKSLWSSLLAENGYTVFPNGLMIQWGRFISNNDNSQTVAFPQPFPFQCFSVLNNLGFAVMDIANTSFSVDRSNSIDGNHEICWFAVGM